MKIIILQAVYDNTDLLTDYFDFDSWYKTYFVCDLEGQKITETKLRDSLKNLPEWLRSFNWDLRKGEKYSMSDHYYNQLKANDIGLTVKNSQNLTVKLRFILTVTFKDTFTMNNDLNGKIPESFQEFKNFVAAKENQRADSKLQRMQQQIN